MGLFSLFQVGLNVADMAAALRFYAEVFGFANGGGQSGWGPGMRLQGLEPEGQALVWWMVAALPRTQLELFHHTGPVQRPQPSDWTPCDHGWVRFGIAVTCHDQVLARLAERGVPILGAAGDGISKGRRFAFRDPNSGVIVEVLEDHQDLPGSPLERVHGLDPAILYATLSVENIGEARHFFGDIIGLSLLPLDSLHRPEHEMLWGLGAAERTGFVAKAGASFIEVVEYTQPRGKQKRPDYRFSDQGIMNVGLFTRAPQTVQAVIDQLDAEERPPRSLITGPGILGTYVLEAGREVEFFSCPEHIEPYLGFTPVGPFLGVDMPDADPDAGIRIIQRFA